MPRAVITFGFLLGLWFLWSGHTEPLIVGFGVAACAITVAFGRALGVLDAEAFRR